MVLHFALIPTGSTGPVDPMAMKISIHLEDEIRILGQVALDLDHGRAPWSGEGQGKRVAHITLWLSTIRLFSDSIDWQKPTARYRRSVGERHPVPR